jgi:hypothetical protein
MHGKFRSSRSCNGLRAGTMVVASVRGQRKGIRRTG